MLTHADVLEALCSELKGPVTLVSRLVEPTLRIPSDCATLFLPDLHLTTEQAAKEYRGYFFRSALHDHLQALLAAANGLHDLTKIQMGDRYDIWRESGVDPERSLQKRVDDIRQAHLPAIANLSSAAAWRFLAGNHDHDLSIKLGKDPCNDAEELIWLGTASAAAIDASALVLHGDVLDLAEALFPAWFKKGILHGIGSAAPEGVKELSRDPTGIIAQAAEGPIDLTKFRPFSVPAWATVTPPLPAVRSEKDLLAAAPGPGFNVYLFPSPKYYVLDTKSGHFQLFTAARARSRAMAQHLGRPAPKVCVIGHTHDPRIILSRREDEQTPFVLMDCGGWVERSRFVDRTSGKRREVPSAHVGVLIGCEARIYQLVTDHL